MQAYEALLHATSTHHAPGMLFPPMIRKCPVDCFPDVLDALNDLKMAYPKTTSKRRQELKSIRKLLER